MEYLDGTAFAVMPGGLLIDMKGIDFNGFWKNDAPSTYAEDHFNLVGHIGSALEHEIWQELTGFDAVSTVRGIQMALAQDPGVTRLDLINTASLPPAYPILGFETQAPTPFVRNEWDIFSTKPTSWADATPPHEFVTFKGSIITTDSILRKSTLTYNSSNGIDGFLSCVDNVENQLLGLPPTSIITSPEPICGLVLTNFTVAQALPALEAHYTTTLAAFNQTFFDYLDRGPVHNFVPADQVYRDTNVDIDWQSQNLVTTIRNNLYIPPTGARYEYILPSRLTVGETFRFSVYIEKIFNSSSGQLSSLRFTISNQSLSANGGYVGLGAK